jgi:hypothetical protein
VRFASEEEEDEDDEMEVEGEREAAEAVRFISVRKGGRMVNVRAGMVQ